VLAEKIYINSGGEHDSFGNILQLFTALPIITTRVFDELSAVSSIALFTDLHIGLDISESYYAYGHAYHPHVFDLERSSFLRELASKYQDFQSFIVNETLSRFIPNLEIDLSTFIHTSDQQSMKMVARERPINVVFVQRSSDRVIIGLEETARQLCNEYDHLKCSLVDLFGLKFSEQLSIFADVDILVAAAGTAIHNLLFCRPSISIIILMQAGWCNYAWMYANQAVLLNMHPYILCHDNHTTSSYHHRHWANQFWKQGPRMLKSEDIHPNLTYLRDAISSIINQSIVHVQEDGFTEYMSLSPMRTYQVYRSFRAVETVDRVIRFESFVSHITSKRLEHSDQWKLELMGEIGAQEEEYLTELGERFPNLSICIDFMDVSSYQATCIPIYRFSYYSDLLLVIDYPILKLHCWLQSSPVTIGEGKLLGSDNYVIINAHLEDGGLRLWQYPPPSIALDFELQLVDGSMHVIAIPPLIEIGDRHPITCSFRYQHTDDSLGLQKYMHSLCREHDLSSEACMNINKVVALDIYSKQYPAVQRLPTPANPFVFLHIEKTAGTTLRE
jgi:hypothetical protein